MTLRLRDRAIGGNWNERRHAGRCDLGTLRDIGLDRLLGSAGHRCRDLVIAMIVARLMWDRLLRSAPARIVNVASEAHRSSAPTRATAGPPGLVQHAL